MVALKPACACGVVVLAKPATWLDCLGIAMAVFGCFLGVVVAAWFLRVFR